MKYYKAPWCPLLAIMSTLLTALCLGRAFAEFRHGGAESWTGWLLVALVVGCAFLTIRGYTITPDAILVHRLVWDTRLPLAGLQSARFEPSPWRGIRIGNGGFFSFTGYRYIPGHGFYRVFATTTGDGWCCAIPTARWSFPLLAGRLYPGPGHSQALENSTRPSVKRKRLLDSRDGQP